MRLPLLSILSISLLPALAVSQGSYKVLGSGCGNGGKAIWSANPKGGTLSPQALTNEYSYPVNVKSTQVTVVTGVRFFTSSRAGVKTVNIRLYKASSTSSTTPDTKALDTTLITVGPKAKFWQASFNKAHIMKGPFWIGMDNVEPGQTTSAVNASNLTSGTNITPVFWRRPPGGTTAWSQTGIVKVPSYQVLTGGSSMPKLSAAAAPKIGSTFKLDLSQAISSRPALAVFGFNDKKLGPIALPLDLTGPAPGCWLFQSLELIFVTASTGKGAASANLPIPNNKNFVGINFMNQWIILNPGGNTLGLLFSNGGKGVIG